MFKKHEKMVLLQKNKILIRNMKIKITNARKIIIFHFGKFHV